MKNRVAIVIILLLIVGGIILVYRSSDREITTSPSTPQNQKPDTYNVVTENVVVDVPLGNASVSSPLEVSGKAKGSWFFEASFPAQVLDEDGKVLGVAVMQAQGDWMTQNFVPFKGSLTFNKPTGLKGTLVLKKDNPSGLPENEAEVRVPIYFQNKTSMGVTR